MSPHSDKIWQGNSAPCASCAQLNAREAEQCAHCGQNLGQDMLQKMAKHSGTWFVFDTVRPFPGVSLERMLSLIKRGALKATSIVRGPTTYYQWRFAIETPLIARHLGHCWSCHAKVGPADQDCPQCKVRLDGKADREQEHLPPPIASIQAATTGDASIELTELSKALSDSGVEVNLTRLAHKVERPLGKIPVIFMGIAIVVVILIVALLSSSEPDQPNAPSTGPAPDISSLTPPSSDGMSRA